MINLYKYTDKEEKELLSSITMLLDTREQKNLHIVEWLDKKNKSHIHKKVEYGDYTFCLPKNEKLGILRDLDFGNVICFERKANIDEYISNLYSDRSRIEKEFSLCPAKMEIIIENNQYKDLRDGNYRSKYKPESVLGTMHSWKYKYGVDFQFMPDPKDTPLYMYLSFYHFLRNYIR
jgi:ERCC4-type nuclease